MELCVNCATPCGGGNLRTAFDLLSGEAATGAQQTRRPALTAPRNTSGPTLLASMRCLRHGGDATQPERVTVIGYYTCSTKAHQGETGCKGCTVPMDKLDTLPARSSKGGIGS
jgi:site-specific DNA recombinase